MAMTATIKPYRELHNAMAYTLQEDVELLKNHLSLRHLSAAFSAPNVEQKYPASDTKIQLNEGSQQYEGNPWVAPQSLNSWAGPFRPCYDQSAYPQAINSLWFNNRSRPSEVIQR